MKTKVYKLVVCIVDHDHLGPEEIKLVLEGARFPNDCISPKVISAEAREVVWDDSHPLNRRATSRQAFEDLFDDRAIRDEDGNCLHFHRGMSNDAGEHTCFDCEMELKEEK